MQYLIDDRLVLSQPPTGPVADSLEAFARLLSAQGYSAQARHRKVLLAAGFSRWLERRHVGLAHVTDDHPGQYLKDRARHVLPRADDMIALRQLLEFLRHQGLVSAAPEPASIVAPAGICAQSYEQYLRDERALAPATITYYGSFARDFLADRFGDGPVRLIRLTAADVVNFVQRRVKTSVHGKRAKLMTCALRSFLRYARCCGSVRLDLAVAVPTVAGWSMPAIPRAISADQVRALLTSIDRHTAMGRRDYAILLLLARLGLRAGEVAFLELDDLDWNQGELRVHGKSGLRSALPLSAEVGKAVADYLRRGRPPSTSRRVFLRAKAPIRGFQSVCAIASIVHHCLQRAGIEAPTRGAHQFRHGLATQMLRRGASLAEIGQVLGHRHPQTTKIYTKVDIEALRTLAMPWPGGAS